MSAAWKDGGGGSFVLDRVFAGVGRIKMASGTDHKPTFKAVNECLTALHRLGRIDLLSGLRDHRYAPLQLLDAWRRAALDSLPTAELLEPLGGALERFRLDHECSPKHRTEMKYSFTHVISAGGAGATIADLPRIVRELRSTLQSKPSMFNRTRAACQAFARVTLGRRHRIWSEISDVPAFKKIAPRRDKQPVMPSELDRICAAITDHRSRRGSAPARVITAADLRGMLWTLATTGMGEKEYWRDGWEDRETYVHIHGVKRAQRDRIVPRVVRPVRPACWPGLMRRVLATASEKALGVVVQPYDLRRSFSQWLEHAGIERTHVRLYMGHGERTMTDVYLWREMLKFVEGDSATLAGWIERDRATAKAKAAATDAATGLRVVK